MIVTNPIWRKKKEEEHGKKKKKKKKWKDLDKALRVIRTKEEREKEWIEEEEEGNKGSWKERVRGEKSREMERGGSSHCFDSEWLNRSILDEKTTRTRRIRSFWKRARRKEDLAMLEEYVTETEEIVNCFQLSLAS